MAAYAQNFQSKSQGLLGYVQRQLSQAVGWNPLPGQLNKIVASSGGYVWGFNVNGDFYVCKEPCDGTNWKQVSRPSGMQGMPLDIAVDAQNVYVLYTSTAAAPPSTATSGITDLGCWKDKESRALTGPPQQYGYTPKTCKDFALSRGTDTFALQDGGWCVTQKPGDDYKKYGKADGVCPERGSAWVNHVYQVTQGPAAGPTTQLSFSTQPVNGAGSWSAPQAIPGAPPVNPEINITDQFIFVGNQGCSKPCTTSSWVPISGPQGGGQSMGIVAASSGSTYVPVNNSGKIKVYAGTGNGQGGWTEKPGLAGKIPIAVEADNQFLYAQDAGSGGVYRCGAPYAEAGSCERANTNGNSVSGNHTISVNPRSYQTYIAAASSGSVGNLYQRLDEGSVNVAPLVEETKKYASGLDSDVNALGNATTAQAAALSAAQTREQAMAAIEQITDLDDKFKQTRIKKGNMQGKILHDKPTPASTSRLLSLQVVAITLISVILIHVVLSLFLDPVTVMMISVVLLFVGLTVAYAYVGVGYRISFSSLK
jgi:hypothetical protein